jgi:hypothetical protein
MIHAGSRHTAGARFLGLPRRHLIRPYTSNQFGP